MIDASFAGEQIAFADRIRAESVAGDFDVGSFFGFIIHDRKAALLQDQAEFSLGRRIDNWLRVSETLVFAHKGRLRHLTSYTNLFL